MEVERRAHPDQQRRPQARAHAVHPLLLLGLARADPHDLRAARRRSSASSRSSCSSVSGVKGGEEAPPTIRKAREALAQSPRQQFALGRLARPPYRYIARARARGPCAVVAIRSGRTRAWRPRCPSARSAHTSGIPSGTASVAAITASIVAGFSRAVHHEVDRRRRHVAALRPPRPSRPSSPSPARSSTPPAGCRGSPRASGGVGCGLGCDAVTIATALAWDAPALRGPVRPIGMHRRARRRWRTSFEQIAAFH